MSLIWMQLREITQKWKMLAREWSTRQGAVRGDVVKRFEVNCHSTDSAHKNSDSPG
jgi:hypothetical protein